MAKGEHCKTAFWLVLAIICAAPSLLAQDQQQRRPQPTYDRGEAGVFAELFRFDAVSPSINFAGVGGRAAVNIQDNLQFEAELAYDFERTFTAVFSNGSTTTSVPTKLQLLTAMFGPKIHTGGRRVRAFVTLKVGVLDFIMSRATVPAGFTTAVSNGLSGDTNGVFYPGGGIEVLVGRIGIRAEVGDQIYFDNGGNNNLRVTVGPQFRF